ncbi:SIS domain-containing protein [Acidisoma cellulosilytica]|uniref:SIS domain-containing protein n=1 Tax=Acidisoma cellulosilyticum TaxID=2802395 RepID=A0A963YXE4_9PROT|nr:SIS domain-containing protein [Acidisoma cellulosilyticum]MCB8878839.1 SIS domain-containing protein [Acidisoma cellulosilyticum]
MDDTKAALSKVGARLRALRPILTPLESRILNEALDEGFDEGTALTYFAGKADVSEAMVVKTAKKLGFTGFRDFREQISAYNARPSAVLHKEIGPEDSQADILRKVFNTAIQALQETQVIIDEDAFAKVVDAISAAPRRDLYGVGGSAQIARDVSHKFLRIGVRCAVYDDAHMMLMSASMLEPGDIAVAFSHSGRTSAVIDGVLEAKRRGATTIAITNYVHSPLVDAVDLVLRSTASGSPLLGENAAARVAQLTVMDAVFAAIAAKAYDVAERNLERTRTAVAIKRVR